MPPIDPPLARVEELAAQNKANTQLETAAVSARSALERSEAERQHLALELSQAQQRLRHGHDV